MSASGNRDESAPPDPLLEIDETFEESIAETERALERAREFAATLGDDDEKTRIHVEEIVFHYNRQLSVLQSRKRQGEGEIDAAEDPADPLH